MDSGIQNHRGWVIRASLRLASRVPGLLAVLILPMALAYLAPAQTFTVLYSFTPPSDPATTLVQDAHGNLYGTTIGDDGSPGTVFKLDTARHLTTLYAFTGGSDGGSPNPELVRDSAGNFYGTTNQGGANGHGVIFKLSRTGSETVLYAFCSRMNCLDGGSPRAGVIRDANGNLYGTALDGGSSGGGVVYKIEPNGQYTVLHGFRGGKDGIDPFAVLARDNAGNVYGTTPMGGQAGHDGCSGGPPGCGVVFKVDAAGKETLLHSFAWGTDGVGPFGGVVLDPAGNLYGATFIGGNHGCQPHPPPPPRGCGTVYEIDKTGKEKILYRWKASSPGEYDPMAGLVRDKLGNLYGTTKYGGDFNCGGGTGCGTVFKLDPRGKLTVLHTFTGGSDGAVPAFRLLLDAHGNLYGTTVASGLARIFKITP